MTEAGTLTGRRHTRAVRVVRPEDCASRWGNEGLNVLSTPAILGTMENVCVELAASDLAEGEMTVGTAIDMTHEAATPQGREVVYEVTLDRVGRHLEAQFVVTDRAGTVLSRGRHRRAVIDRDQFLARLEET